MAAHKPVEWVQAVVARFDEQVTVAGRGLGPGGTCGCASLAKGAN